MIKKFLRKFKIGRGAAKVIDAVATEALDKATKGISTDIIDAVEKRTKK